MADFDPSFASDGERRLATPMERELGFGCGPADLALFNGLFNQLQAELAAIHAEAGVTPDDTTDTTTLDAILALISAATGGNPEGYVLMTQARARLPIFPEVMNADGRIVVTSPGAGTIRIPGGVDFVHRGIFSITTAQMDFSTEASKIYHLRWDPTNGYRLRDTGDAGYNPTSAAETSAIFDSTYDDMLIARVVMNSSNVATITNLANKSVLTVQKFIEGTNRQVDPVLSSTNWFSVTDTFNWARSPTTFDLTVARGFTSGHATDGDFSLRPAGAAIADLTNLPPLFDVTRYRISQTVMRDETLSLFMNFTARA